MNKNIRIEICIVSIHKIKDNLHNIELNEFIIQKNKEKNQTTTKEN